jgi:hypothetical protein
MGRAYGAPRLRATTIERLGPGRPVTPARLERAPGPADEWRLVRVSGRIADVRRLGGRWRAELVVGPDRIVVDGLAGAKIPASSLVEGRSATIVGIVRRPYPTASDRRFAVVPRGPADVAVGPPPGGAAPAPGGGSGRVPGAESGRGLAGSAPSVVDVDLADLARYVGSRVRIGGLVVELEADGFVLDDGTAAGRVVLTGAAADYLDLVEPGDAVNVVGVVRTVPRGIEVVVAEAAGLIPVGDLGEPSILVEPETEAMTATPDATGSDHPSEAGLGGQGAAPPLLPLGLVVVGSGIAILVPLVLRERARLRLAARMQARLTAIRRGKAP